MELDRPDGRDKDLVEEIRYKCAFLAVAKGRTDS